MPEKTQAAGSGIARKLLMPLVATAVSAVAAYAGKRAPQLLEQRVMPKLREASSGPADLASGFADRAKAVVGGGDGRGGSHRSAEDLETRRRERADRRRGRRSGLRAKED